MYAVFGANVLKGHGNGARHDHCLLEHCPYVLVPVGIPVKWEPLMTLLAHNVTFQFDRKVKRLEVENTLTRLLCVRYYMHVLLWSYLYHHYTLVRCTVCRMLY